MTPGSTRHVMLRWNEIHTTRHGLAPTESKTRGIFRLRPLALEDVRTAARWHEQVEDLALFDRHMPVPLSADAMEASWREAIDAREPRTNYWFMVTRAGGDSVCLVGLPDINHTHGDGVLALFVADAWRGRGLGIRAIALILDLAFDQLRLTRVSTCFRDDNGASRRLTQRCGFAHEGLVRQGWFSGGKHIDIVLVGILTAEWRAAREKLRRELDAGTTVMLGTDCNGLWSWPGTGTE